MRRGRLTVATDAEGHAVSSAAPKVEFVADGDEPVVQAEHVRSAVVVAAAL